MLMCSNSISVDWSTICDMLSSADVSWRVAEQHEENAVEMCFLGGENGLANGKVTIPKAKLPIRSCLFITLSLRAFRLESRGDRVCRTNSSRDLKSSRPHGRALFWIIIICGCFISTKSYRYLLLSVAFPLISLATNCHLSRRERKQWRHQGKAAREFQTKDPKTNGSRCVLGRHYPHRSLLFQLSLPIKWLVE